MADGIIAFNILMRKPIGKRPPGELSRRWDDKIGIYLKYVGIDRRTWIYLAQDKVYWRY